MIYLMLLSLIAPLLVMGCASPQLTEANKIYPAQLKVLGDNGMEYYTCLYNQETNGLKCALDTDGLSKEPRCL